MPEAEFPLLDGVAYEDQGGVLADCAGAPPYLIDKDRGGRWLIRDGEYQLLSAGPFPTWGAASAVRSEFERQYVEAMAARHEAEVADSRFAAWFAQPALLRYSRVAPRGARPLGDFF